MQTFEVPVRLVEVAAQGFLAVGRLRGPPPLPLRRFDEPGDVSYLLVQRRQQNARLRQIG